LEGFTVGAPAITAPHFAQNFAPVSMLAPQELQKAMVHLSSA